MSRRDYPHRFFWGIAILLTGIYGCISAILEEPAGLIFIGPYTAIGAFLTWQGWQMSATRTRKGL